MVNLTLPAILAALIPITIKVIVVIILLDKKALKIFSLALLLYMVNVVTFILFFNWLEPSLFEHPPNIWGLIMKFNLEALITYVAYAMLVIVVDLLVLVITMRLSIFRKHERLHPSFKGTMVPVLKGNIVSIVLVIFIMLIPTA